MQYLLSLPVNWKPNGSWPIVMVIDSANREFRGNLQAFIDARGTEPMILAAPFAISNGGTAYRSAPAYPYSEGVWNRIERETPCRFDLEGIAAIAADLHKLYSGERRYFLTGWEAAGHTVWALLFRHPEALRAAIPVTPNYAGRCVTAGDFSSDPSRATLPVHVIRAGNGPAPWPNPFFEKQSADAMRTAQEHGFRSVTSAVAENQPHGPLAREVIEFIGSFQAGSRSHVPPSSVR